MPTSMASGWASAHANWRISRPRTSSDNSCDGSAPRTRGARGALARARGARRGRSVLGHAHRGERLPAEWRDGEGPAVGNARDQASGEESLRQGGAHGAGDVVASLGPVDAAAAVLTLRAPRLREIDAEPREESLTARSDFPTTVDE